MTNNDSTSKKNSSNSSCAYSKRRFTPTEDSIIISLAKPNCSNDWSIIAKSVEKRSARQCRDRWNNYLNPNLNKDEWIPEEDELLMKIFNEKGPQWKSFSLLFKGRSINNVRNRCFKLLRKSQSHRGSNQILEHPKNNFTSYKKGDKNRNESLVLEKKFNHSNIKDQCKNINSHIPPDPINEKQKIGNLQIDKNVVLDADYFFYDDDEISKKSTNIHQKEEDKNAQPNFENTENSKKDCSIDTSVVDKLMSKLEREFSSTNLFSWGCNYDMDMEVSHPNLI